MSDTHCCCLRVEQDKIKILAEIADVRAATDEVNRSKASAEKSYRNLLNNLNDLNKKVEETNLHLGDLEAAKRRLTAENADVLRQLQVNHHIQLKIQFLIFLL